MNRTTFRLVVILAVVSVTSMLVIQLFWMGKAFDLSNKQFEYNVNIALLNVTSKLCEINQNDLLPDPIEQLSSNYFVVNLNNRIAPDILESVLTSEFSMREIGEDFEYGIFDCADEGMVYGNYVKLNDQPAQVKEATIFPLLNKDAYYFGVYFPNKPSNLAGEMWIWGFSSLVLVMVIIFFSYTLFVIFKQTRLAEIQKDFIDNMTHEFKTPIAAISLSAEVLASDVIIDQPGRLKQYAGIVKKESARLKNQVERVLQMTDLDRQQIELTLNKEEINGMISEILESVKLSIEDLGGVISFRSALSEIELSIDKVHFTNIIYNLIDNAIKYGGEVPVVSLCTEVSGEYCNIIIGDNGGGVKKKDQSLIFEKFYRVPTGNIHDIKGFGLGLYYVKSVVEAHDGAIRVKSSKEGSKFIVSIPNKLQ